MNIPLLLKPVAQRLGLYSQLRWLTPYNRKSLAFHRQFIHQGGLCFDVGANVGDRTDVYLKLGKKVVAIEPEPNAFRVLRTKFADDRRVVLINKGLSETTGTTKLFVPTHPDTDGPTTMATMTPSWIETIKPMFPGIDYANSIDVELSTLDLLISEYGLPDFCKIDVEGHEQSVLRGLSTPLPLVSFEYTIGRPDDVVACIEILESLGEYEFNHSSGSTFRFGNSQFLGKAEFISMIVPVIKSAQTYGDIYCKLANNNRASNG